MQSQTSQNDTEQDQAATPSNKSGTRHDSSSQKTTGSQPIQSKQGKAGVYQSKEGKKGPIQSKQGKAGAYQSKEGKKGPIQTKQKPIQRNQEPVTSGGAVNEAQIKANVGSLTGVDVSNAQVKYNSERPAQFKAEAIAQGDRVDLATGKEKHLGHELVHIAQQKQGRVPVTAQANNGKVNINDDPQLEKEADDLGAKAMQMKANDTATLTNKTSADHPPAQLKASSQVIQRVAYADLEDFQKVKVDQEANKVYEQKAEEYEQLVGKHFERSDASHDIANKLLKQVKKIVDQWADATGQKNNKLEAYAQEFKYEKGDKYYGAFQMTGANIKQVFDTLSRTKLKTSQPLRTKLKIIYNAIRNNNLAKWLKVASDHMESMRINVAVFDDDAGFEKGKQKNLKKGSNQKHSVDKKFAHRSGLKKIFNKDKSLHKRVKEASSNEKREILNGDGEHFHIAAPDAFSSIASGTPAEAAVINEGNKDRLGSRNKDVPLDEQRGLTAGEVPDLTPAEIALIEQRRDTTTDGPKTFNGNANDKLGWEQGREALNVIFNSTLEKEARSIGARLEAGISGSTNMMFAAAKNLGINGTKDLQKLRLAMLGWMIPNHDHSLYEIMKVAEAHGVPFQYNATHKGMQYEHPDNFTPTKIDTLRGLLLDGKFPAYFLTEAYKDTLANDFLNTDRGRKFNSSEEVKAHITEQLGIPATSINGLDGRALLEITGLSDVIERQNGFADETGTPEELKKAKAMNRLKFDYIREAPAYHYLRHNYPVYAEFWMARLLNHHGKPSSDEHALLMRANSTTLGASNANAAGRKQALVTAGAPEHLLADIPERLIDNLLTMNAMIANLALDATKSVQHADNQGEYNKIFRSNAWAEIEKKYKDDNGTIWVILGKLFKAAHGDLIYSSVVNRALRTPEGLELLALGIPDSMVRVLIPENEYEDENFELPKSEDSKIDNKQYGYVTAMAQDIEGIASSSKDTQIAQLQALTITYAHLKDFIDDEEGERSFDLMVAAIARNKGINLSSDKAFKTLANLAEALNTAGTIATPNAQETDLQGNQFSSPLKNAEQELRQNLKEEQKVNNGATATDFAGLTDVEIASINEYTKPKGMGIWQKSISNKTTKGRQALKTSTRIQAAVSGLRKLPSYNGTVYNAQKPMDADLTAANIEKIMARYAVGTVHSHDNFLSTSTTTNNTFFKDNKYKVAWIIENSRNGKYIAPLSGNYLEKEVLFQPGSSFIVTKVVDRTNDTNGPKRVWVYLDEV